jgi:hypothetical protein
MDSGVAASCGFGDLALAPPTRMTGGPFPSSSNAMRVPSAERVVSTASILTPRRRASS